MFETWVTRAHDRARLESSALCRELVAFAELLEGQGYRPLTLRRYLFAAVTFVGWIRRRGWAIGEVDESRVQQFIVGHRRQKCRGRHLGRLPTAMSGVRRFVQGLRARGVMPATVLLQSGPIDEIVAALDSPLERVSGLGGGAPWHGLRR